MIVEATANDILALPPTSEAAVRILSQYQAYGCHRPFLRFWACGDGGILSLMDGMAVVALPENKEHKKSAAETALFLQMHPDVVSVRADGETAAIIAEVWGTGRQTGVVMTPEDPAAWRNLSTEQSVYTPPLPDLYELLTAVFGYALPAFDAWYADVHHRLRHGCCRIKAVEREGRPVSAAMTVAECADAAIIGAVATSPHHRGKGYAAACVATLTSELIREGKRVLLSPKNAYARQLYEAWGFTVCGSWGTVTRP